MKEPSAKWTQEEKTSIACMLALVLKSEAQKGPVRRERIVDVTTAISLVLTKPAKFLEDTRKSILLDLPFEE